MEILVSFAYDLSTYFAYLLAHTVHTSILQITYHWFELVQIVVRQLQVLVKETIQTFVLMQILNEIHSFTSAFKPKYGAIGSFL